jgi:tetratricopeptide (TPR) repeat protein
MRKILLGACLAVLAAGGARASVTVFGDAAAGECSKAAIEGKADPVSENFCTTALDFDTLDAEDRAGTFVNRGVMKLRRAEYEPARADFDAALKLVPAMGEAWVNRGAMWVGEKRYQSAVDDLNKGITLGVSEPEKAYFNRALAYEGLDDEKSAYLDYRQALAIKPDWLLPQKELLRFTVTHR